MSGLLRFGGSVKEMIQMGQSKAWLWVYTWTMVFDLALGLSTGRPLVDILAAWKQDSASSNWALKLVNADLGIFLALAYAGYRVLPHIAAVLLQFAVYLQQIGSDHQAEKVFGGRGFVRKGVLNEYLLAKDDDALEEHADSVFERDMDDRRAIRQEVAFLGTFLISLFASLDGPTLVQYTYSVLFRYSHGEEDLGLLWIVAVVLGMATRLFFMLRNGGYDSRFFVRVGERCKATLEEADTNSKSSVSSAGPAKGSGPSRRRPSREVCRSGSARRRVPNAERFRARGAQKT